MFTLKTPETVKCPVTINVPSDGGVPVPEEVTIEYRYLDRAQADALIAECGNSEAKFMQEIVVGWEGIGDADGNALPFSAENLALLARHNFIVNALIGGFYLMSGGARTKN